ncbi:hypothetical protein MCC93_22630 [Morococcus cerebrosus]|uniref:Uncharacterized protein n=1 Tax=Morococcus cerebrosus TaxID=1056807 RepID=A0A0C1EBS9_9NEIS|nr:hypothetical protein MCC93_22630 [Morococcus cerebrosus]KJJ14190.1 hypothetical protein HMPREF3156_02108 [Neisseria sp. HMSC06F02]
MSRARSSETCSEQLFGFTLPWKWKRIKTQTRLSPISLIIKIKY